MSTEEKIRVMLAYISGEQIQFRRVGTEKWQDANPKFEIAWNWVEMNYRIKPEINVRPYANAQEFLKAMKEHGPYYRQIDMVDTDFFMMPGSVTNVGFCTYNGTTCTYEEFSKMYEWQDETPCGIEE